MCSGQLIPDTALSFSRPELAPKLSFQVSLKNRIAPVSRPEERASFLFAKLRLMLLQEPFDDHGIFRPAFQNKLKLFRDWNFCIW